MVNKAWSKALDPLARSKMGGFFARLRGDQGDTRTRGQQPTRVNEQDKAVLVSLVDCGSRSRQER